MYNVNIFSHYSMMTNAIFITATPPMPVYSKIISIMISNLPAT